MSLNRWSQRVNKPLLIFCLIAILLIGIVFRLASAREVHADAYTVCATGCDFTTIQAAIDDTSVVAGDVINVTDAFHTEFSIVVNKDVTLQGQGAFSTTVQAHAVAGKVKERVFFIADGATVTIKDMTIRHGNPTSEPESGGGIRNEGTLTLENSVVRNNSGSAGGGILNDGTLTLINSTVRDNEARGGGDAYMECSTGGGIKNMEGTLDLINSTVAGNTAEGKGGGIHVACKGTLVLVNSTISGNYTNDDGGGVYLDGVGKFEHGTICDNEAHDGGGIFISGSTEKGAKHGLLDYANTIIANNSARMEKYGIGDCRLGDYGSIGVNSRNLVEDGNCSPHYSSDPRLADLSDDSDVPIHELLPGSPAIDVIPNEECTTNVDQRGVSRPQAAGCDVGAVEWQPGEIGGLNSTKCTGPIVILLILLVVGLVNGWRRQSASEK